MEGHATKVPLLVSPPGVRLIEKLKRALDGAFTNGAACRVLLKELVGTGKYASRRAAFGALLSEKTGELRGGKEHKDTVLFDLVTERIGICGAFGNIFPHVVRQLNGSTNILFLSTATGKIPEKSIEYFAKNPDVKRHLILNDASPDFRVQTENVVQGKVPAHISVSTTSFDPEVELPFQPGSLNTVLWYGDSHIANVSIEQIAVNVLRALKSGGSFVVVDALPWIQPPPSLLGDQTYTVLDNLVSPETRISTALCLKRKIKGAWYKELGIDPTTRILTNTERMHVPIHPLDNPDGNQSGLYLFVFVKP